MRSLQHLLLLSAFCVVLCGCPDNRDGRKVGGLKGPSDIEAGGTSNEVSTLAHVRVGQVYRFKGISGGVPTADHFRVTKILVDQHQVSFDHVAIVQPPNIKPMRSEPAPGVWGVPPDWKELHPNPLRKQIPAAGRVWDCVVLKEGKTTTFVPVQNGLPTWPRYIRREGPNPGEVTQLEEIEEP